MPLHEKTPVSEVTEKIAGLAGETPALDNADAIVQASEGQEQSPFDLLRATHELIKQTKEEYTLTQDSIDEARGLLNKQTLEANELIASNKPLPENFLGNTHEYVNNIRTEQQKLAALQERLDALKKQEIGFAKEAIEDVASKAGNAIRDHSVAGLTAAKNSLEYVKSGIIDIGNAVHTKVEAFKNGARDALQDVGTKAELIYEKTIAKVQDVHEHFRTKVQTLMQGVKDKASELGENILAGRELKAIETLSEKMERALGLTERFQGDGSNLTQNTLYNFSLDNSRRLAQETKDLVASQVKSMEERISQGKPVDMVRFNKTKELGVLVTNRSALDKEPNLGLPGSDALQRAGRAMQNIADKKPQMIEMEK